MGSILLFFIRMEGAQGGPKNRGMHPTPLNPTPATCHKPNRKLRCSFRNAALQKLHCNIGFSAVRMSFSPKTALQQAKNCSATLTKLRCRKVALSCGFQAPTFRHPRLGPAERDGELLRRSVFTFSGCNFFAYSWKLPAYRGALCILLSGSFCFLLVCLWVFSSQTQAPRKVSDAAFLLTVGSFLTVDNFSIFIDGWSFLAYSFSFSTYSWSFFAYGGKVRLIRALWDCKQRSLTVSKQLQL